MKLPSLEDVKVGSYDVAFLVPFDIGCTFPHRTRVGPQGIRRISAGDADVLRGELLANLA